MKIPRLLLLCLAGLLLAACSQDDPSTVVMEYWKARVAANAAQMQQLSCAAWETQAITQSLSFQSMNAELRDVTCRTTAQDGDTARVECDGQIVTDYNGEQREWELEPYRVTRENGEWRICGEAEAS